MLGYTRRRAAAAVWARGVRGPRVVAWRPNLARGLATRDEEPLPPSLMEKYKLDDPTRFVPLTLGALGLGTVSGLYHIDGETQLLVLWVLFCGTIYSRGGPMIAEMMDEVADQVEMEQKALEEAELEAAKLALQAHKNNTSIYEDMMAVNDAMQGTAEYLVKIADLRLRRGLQEKISRQLDALVQNEEQYATTLRSSMVEKAHADVLAAFQGGDAKKLKTSALDAAVSVLSNPKGGRKDMTVSNLYTKSIKDFKQKLDSMEGKEVELSPEQLQASIEEVESFLRKEELEGVDFDKSNKVVFHQH